MTDSPRQKYVTEAKWSFCNVTFFDWLADDTQFSYFSYPRLPLTSLKNLETKFGPLSEKT